MFLLLILVHELGHFIAAKSVGVKVNEFAIGFGPTILRKKWGETTYMLKLIPFGGYCAMEGEDENSADENAFCNKAAWKRGIVVIAGAVFNLILGMIIVGITLLPQERFTSTTVAEFAESAV
ncbi:MAG: site-2 protease family protein, partial [Clostridia bacterium]|nr:site-2 protease family protein [Clostridia bacterium]